MATKMENDAVIMARDVFASCLENSIYLGALDSVVEFLKLYSDFSDDDEAEYLTLKEAAEIDY